jgi:alpha-tubulin suppressor-like RCC1 family protein
MVAFSALTAGQSQVCGVTVTGDAACCPANVAQVSIPPATATPVPINAGGVVFASLVAGSAHACGRTETGSVYCWGDNEYGQLGVPQSAGSAPVATPNGVLAGTLAAGSDANGTCIVTPAGEVWCWGSSAVVGNPRDVGVFNLDRDRQYSGRPAARPALIEPQ